MNDLEKYFNNNSARLINKWHHYFDVYDRHFSKYRNKEVHILEIGVFQGGSLQMWKDYFGDKAKIYGIDINPLCKNLEEENVKIFIGSQKDKKFLNEVISSIPPIDILIDDGGHTMQQQIVSFEELFYKIKDDGVYLCEDCHTSYWYKFGGGYKRWGSFIEYSKNWIDYINAYHSKSWRLKVNKFTDTARSLHYYDSIVVVEKSPVKKPFSSQTGEFSYAIKEDKVTALSLAKKYLNRVYSVLNLPFFID